MIMNERSQLHTWHWAVGVLAALAFLLSACGTPTQPPTMALSAADALQLRTWVPEGLKGNVELAPVTGGEATGRWWGAKVSSAALAQALEESLRGVGMLPLALTPAPKYQLRAALQSLEQPLVPVEVSVTAAVQYSLVDSASGVVLYQRTVRTVGNAGLGDALISPPERLRLASEAAVRANINAAVRDLLSLRLPESATR